MKVFFRTIHLYLSLAAGIIIFSSCVTGTILVFEEDFDHLLHKERYYVTPGGKQLPAAQLIATALKEAPQKSRFSGIKIYSDPTRSAEISLAEPQKPGESKGGEMRGGKAAGKEARNSRETGDGKERRKGGEKGTEVKGKRAEKRKGKGGLTVYINPYTGKVIEVAKRGKSFFKQVEMFHRFLLAGKDSIGNKIVSISTTFFLFIIITGIVLWWPKTVNIMKQRLKIKFSGSRKRLVHDLHVVTGFYTSIFLVITVLTGLIMSYQWANKLMFTLTGSSNKEVEAPSSVYQAGLKPVGIDPVIGRAKQLVPDAEFYNIRVPNDSAGVYTVNVVPAGNISNVFDTYFINQYSGQLADKQLFAQRSLGQRIRALVKPVHTGAVYGMPTKILAFIISLLTATFPVTGVMMWLNRTKKKGKKRVAPVDMPKVQVAV